MDPKNTICLHFAEYLEETSRLAIESQLRKKLPTFQILHEDDEAPIQDKNFCIYFKAEVELYEEFFTILLEAVPENFEAVHYFDYEIEDGFVNNKKYQIAPPHFSYFRFLSNDYLGPVLLIDRRSKVSAKHLNLKDFQIEREIVNKKILPKLNEVYAYKQIGTYFQDLKFRSSAINEILEDSRFAFRVQNHAPFNLEIIEPRPLKISLIIPTRGTSKKGSQTSLVVNAIRSTLSQNLENLDLEIVVVYDIDTDTDYLDEIRTYCKNFKLKIIPYEEAFNFSRKCNLGAEQASGEVIVFLNDDVEWISKDGLRNISQLALLEEVGAVGAKLLFENNTLQHVGMLTQNGLVGHSYFRELDPIGYFGDLKVVHEVMGVTGACLAQRKSIWEECGKWDDKFANSYNDVDYCFRLRNSGFLILQDNGDELFHFESLTRDPSISDSDFALLNKRWASDLANDRFFRQFNVDQEKRHQKEKLIYSRLNQAVQVLSNYGLKTLVVRSVKFLIRKLRRNSD